MLFLKTIFYVLFAGKTMMNLKKVLKNALRSSRTWTEYNFEPPVLLMELVHIYLCKKELQCACFKKQTTTKFIERLL